MNGRMLRASLGACAGIALALSIAVAWSWARGIAPPPPAPPAGEQAGGQAGDSVPAASLNPLVVHDPFRARRAPAPIAYDPVALAAGPPPPAPPKPVLTLTGIAWGAEPEAVIEGLPSTDGPRVVRVGETVGGFKVKRIASDRVVITGMDTTWTLTVREPWR
jgi:hypothetical protein